MKRKLITVFAILILAVCAITSCSTQEEQPELLDFLNYTPHFNEEYIVLEKSAWVPSNLYSFSLKWFSLLFTHPVVSNSLWLHGQQHTRPLFPSPCLEVCPISCPLHRWCHPAISSFDAPFSLYPQSFLASGTFPMSQLFASDDQNTGASASVLPMTIQG